MGMLSDKELAELVPAWQASSPTPVPTQIVSSDEYLPVPQTEQQHKVEARLNEMGDESAGRGPVAPPLLPDRRRHGGLVRGDERGVRPAVRRQRGRSREPELAQAARRGLKASSSSTVTRISCATTPGWRALSRMREAVGKAGWNRSWPARSRRSTTSSITNYFKEIYLDSDTKVALICRTRRRRCREDWFIPQEQVFETRDQGQRKGRLAPHAGAFHLHAGLGRAGSTRSTRRSSATSRIRGRATRSATTPTRSWRAIRGASTTKS